jgi:hypothetical protein
MGSSMKRKRKISLARHNALIDLQNYVWLL